MGGGEKEKRCKTVFPVCHQPAGFLNRRLWKHHFIVAAACSQ